MRTGGARSPAGMWFATRTCRPCVAATSTATSAPAGSGVPGWTGPHCAAIAHSGARWTTSSRSVDVGLTPQDEPLVVCRLDRQLAAQRLRADRGRRPRAGGGDRAIVGAGLLALDLPARLQREPHPSAGRREGMIRAPQHDAVAV